MNSLQEQTTLGNMTLTIPCFNCGKTVNKELNIYDSGIERELSSILLEIGFYEYKGKFICKKCFDIVCI